MAYLQDSPGETLSVQPSRQFSFIIDPDIFPSFDRSPHADILLLLHDLQTWAIPIELELLLPTYLAGSAIRSFKHPRPPFQQLTKPLAGPDFSPDTEIPEGIRNKFAKGDEESQRVLGLLSLAVAAQADGLVTSSTVLVEARYALYQHHLIRVIPLEEFADVVEVFCHGHSLFWSVTNTNRRLIVDIYYQFAHWKNSRLYHWANKVLPTLSNKNIQEHLRSLLFKRYSFVLYGRDHIRFYELQRDYFTRRGLSQRFVGPLGYHVINFYFLVWGILEELTLIAKYRRGLTLADKDCGIAKKQFWDELSLTEPGLTKFIQTDPIAEWVTLMADMRHLAAHDVIPTPTMIVKPTIESQKSEVEILKEIKEEHADLYSILPPEYMTELEPFLVSNWRIKKMKIVAEGMVAIDRKGRGYLRNPVVSVDYDLAMLNAVVDAFIVKLFSAKERS